MQLLGIPHQVIFPVVCISLIMSIVSQMYASSLLGYLLNYVSGDISELQYKIGITPGENSSLITLVCNITLDLYTIKSDLHHL